MRLKPEKISWETKYYLKMIEKSRYRSQSQIYSKPCIVTYFNFSNVNMELQNEFDLHFDNYSTYKQIKIIDMFRIDVDINQFTTTSPIPYYYVWWIEDYSFLSKKISLLSTASNPNCYVTPGYINDSLILLKNINTKNLDNNNNNYYNTFGYDDKLSQLFRPNSELIDVMCAMAQKYYRIVHKIDECTYLEGYIPRIMTLVTPNIVNTSPLFENVYRYLITVPGIERE